MTRREFNRRAFLGGAAGVGVGTDTAFGDGPRASPAFSLPGIDNRHRVRWHHSDGEETAVYPTVVADDTVVTIVRKPRDETDNEDGNRDRPRFELLGLAKRDGSVRWRHEFREYPSLPTLVDGTVLLQTERYLRAFAVATGNELWTFERRNFRTGDILTADGRVFVTASESESEGEGERRVAVYALDATDGQVVWKRPSEAADERPMIARLVGGGDLYLVGQGAVVAVDAADGSERWRTSLGDHGPFPIARQGDALLLWATNSLVAVEAKSGAERWRRSFDGADVHGFRGAVTDGTVFVWGRKLLALNARTGSRRWAFDPETQVEGHGAVVAVEDGTVYTGVGRQLYALDAKSGTPRWEWTGGSNFHDYWGGVRDGVVYAMGERTVYALDADSGDERWTYLNEGAVVYWLDVRDDSVYFAADDGTLYAVDRPSPLATAPVATLLGVATSGPGLAALGLAGVGVLAAGYRRKRRAARPDVELGRLERIRSGPLTETHRKRVRTPDGHAVVAETRLTEQADEETAAAFADAVERWAALDVDGVLPIRDRGTDPRPWYETPYAAGGSLADAWPVAPAQRVEAVSAAARTLHRAHERNVVHGRLSPASVFLPAPGEGVDARVGGWFIPEAAQESPAGYAAPEQPAEATPQTDVYRLAALGYHVLTGEVPGVEPEAPSALNPALSGEVDDVLTTGLAADPAARHESALQFDDVFRWSTLER